MIIAMGQDRTPHVIPDPARVTESSSSARGQFEPADAGRRHVLPKDLPNAVKHLSDRELDLLITASLEEAKRRGRSPASIQPYDAVPKQSPRTDNRRQVEVAAVSLTRGQLNAVRAAFKAGIKPSLIARQFGISQSDVRRVLASDASVRGGR
jgi:hypothetical protein